VNNLTNKVKSSGKTGIVFILIGIACLFQNEVFSQKSSSAGWSNSAPEIAPSTIKLDSTLKIKEKPKGLIRKIIQPVKFRENRDFRNKDSIYHFMLKLVKNGQLRIDPQTINQIINSLDQIVAANQSDNKLIDGRLNANDFTSQTNSAKIDGILEKFNIQDKATQAVFDSLKTQMGAFIQANAIRSSQDDREIQTKINTALKEIRKVQYSTTSHLSEVESGKINDTLSFFKRSLQPKIKVIGWHRSGMDDEFQRYNYNYLSAINLDNYELSETGGCKNPKDIKEFQKPGNIIAVAQSKGCDVHLTIYNNDPDEIKNFLRNTIARKTFLSGLDSLVIKSKLKGVNINFDCTIKPEPFVKFITELYQSLKRINPEIQLNISIPAVVISDNEEKIASYNFEKLNPMVDFYFVLTDNMIPQDAKFPQATSPLYKSDKFRNQTIESTFSYYTNNLIPASKIILTLAYSGSVWAVDNFSGHGKTQQTGILKYSEILEYYENQTVAKGFDPDQSTTFLNVLGSDSSLLEQIWFEDYKSLYLKYNWALDNGLGGVAISGLGNDDKYPELWDALGASVIQIDTTLMGNPNLSTGSMKKFWRILINTYEGFKLETLKQDLKWARSVRLKYESTDTILGYRRFDHVLNPSIGSVDDSIAKYVTTPIIWQETTPYIPDINTNNECYLPTLSYCYSLYSRWLIYAKFLKWCFYLFLALAVIFAVISFNLERYLRGDDKYRSIIRNMPSALGLFTVMFFCSWMFIDPSIKWLGTGSADGTDSLVMIYILIFGIVFGWFCASNYYKYKSS